MPHRTRVYGDLCPDRERRLHRGCFCGGIIPPLFRVIVTLLTGEKMSWCRDRPSSRGCSSGVLSANHHGGSPAAAESATWVGDPGTSTRCPLNLRLRGVSLSLVGAFATPPAGGAGRWGVEPCVLLPNTPHCAALTQPHDGSGYRASFPREAVPTFFAHSAMACPLLWGDALSVSHVYGSTVTLLGWCCLSACCLPPVLLVESPTPPARLPG